MRQSNLTSLLGDILDINSVLSFLWEIRYIILFYFFGDIITTLYALRIGGTEGNAVVRAIIDRFGGIGFVAVKMIPIILLYGQYINIDGSPLFWMISKWFITIVYVVANIHNLRVIRALMQKSSAVSNNA